MREHEYRAWHKTEKRMFKVFRLSWFGGVFLIGDRDSEHGLRFGTGEVELMEYTGLRDRKGQKIYEGDIILTIDTKWVVAWHRHENGMVGWMVKDNEIHHWYVIDESILRRGEIIGNIYECS